MKIKELIELLNKYDDELDISLRNTSEGYVEIIINKVLDDNDEIQYLYIDGD